MRIVRVDDSCGSYQLLMIGLIVSKENFTSVFVFKSLVGLSFFLALRIQDVCRGGPCVLLPPVALVEIIEHKDMRVPKLFYSSFFFIAFQKRALYESRLLMYRVQGLYLLI